MNNGCRRHACVKGFDFEYVIFKKTIIVFENMEIAENIYEYTVEPSYKTKNNTAQSTRSVHVNK